MTLYDKHTIIYMKNNGSTWQELDEHFGVTPDTIRNYARSKDWYNKIRQHNPHDGHKDEFERYSEQDGVVTHEIKKRMAEKQTFTRDELLELHSLDPTEFKIKQVVSNEWSMTEQGGQQYYNFQSKIIAEPLTEEDTLHERLGEVIQSYVQPFNIECRIDELSDSYLMIPLFDLHFGINTAEDYAGYQEQIMRLLENRYKKVAVILGGDFFNTNDFKSQTINQTRVNDTNIPNAWEEAILFMSPLLEKALSTSPEIEVIYNRGNHSETVDWTFTQYLKAKYPQVLFDDSTQQLKVVELGDAVFFSTHGHIRKQPKDLISLCSAVYPKEWYMAKRRFVLTGHKHHDKEEDFPGITYVQVTSPSKATDYEDENMYLGTQNGMRLFEVTDENGMNKHYL